MPTGIYKRTEEHKAKISNTLTGHIVSEITRAKIAKAQRKIPHKTGEKAPNWRGKNVGYSALHMWVRAMLGAPKICWHCGNTNGKARNYHWANISGKYLRSLADWARLCVSCHKLYDLGKLELKLRYKMVKR